MSSSSSDDDDLIRDRFVGQTYGLDAGRRNGSVPFVSAAAAAPDLVPSYGGTAPRSTTRLKPADFEKHTKGFGSKYLAKYGFKGRLGKQETGIAAPIEAKQRPIGMGLGFNDVDSKPEPKPNKKAEGPAAQPRPRPSWRRDAVQQAVVYKTAQEVLGTKLQSRMAATFVDMTSRHGARVKSFGDLRADRDDDGTVAVLPELEHNLQLLVNMAEADLERLERKRLINRNEIDALEARRDVVQSKVTAAGQMTQRLEQVQAAITRLAQRLQQSTAERLSLSAAADVFEMLQHGFQSEYREFRLESLAASLMSPVMAQWFRIGDPILDRGGLPDDFERWRFLLPAAVYDEICNGLVLPKLRSSLMSLDLVHDCDVLSEAVAAWSPALSPSVLNSVFDTVLIPALLRVARQCHPLQDVVQAHVWAHPWLPVLGEERLRPVHEQICRRFISCLSQWSPDDPSALLALQPWQNVFELRDLNRLKEQAIIPKLSQALVDQALGSRYATADVPAIDWSFQWSDFLGEPVLLDLLESSVWPKLLRSVQVWVRQHPDYSTLLDWYSRWKSRLSSRLMKAPRTRQMLRHVLVLINCQTSGGDVQLLLHQILQRIDSDRLLRDQTTVKVRPKLGRDSFTSAPAPASLHIRDLVAKYAEMNDLEFVPNVRLGRFQGKQIFTFGTANIYLESNCVYYLPKKSADRDRWVAIGLSDLLQVARQ